MIKVCLLLLVLLLPCRAFAQETARVIPLWEKGAPGFEARRDIPEQAKDYWVRSIHNPSVTVFLPPKEKANGCAVLVAPGGGFRELVFHEEGEKFAAFMTQQGVAVFALKYRLPREAGSPYSDLHPKQDALRAMRLIRSRAAEFVVDPRRVGMVGFSAGGALTLMVTPETCAGDAAAPDPIDRLSGRPDFQILVYPGKFSAVHIGADSPPAFMICANDDELGCDEVTLGLLEDFRSAKVPVTCIMLSEGKHAFNMGDRSTRLEVRNWPFRMLEWMQDRGVLGSGGLAEVAPVVR